MKHLHSFCLCLALSSTLPALLQASPDMDAEQGPISGLNAVSVRIHERAKIQVLLPTDFSHIKKQYVAYLVKAEPREYEMSIDGDEECRAAKFCRIGSFRANIGENPIIHYSMENKMMTQMVTLKGGVKAFYTEGYALGSYFAPQIAWRCKSVLYRLSWNEASGDSQKILMNMANSALQEGNC